MFFEYDIKKKKCTCHSIEIDEFSQNKHTYIKARENTTSIPLPTLPKCSYPVPITPKIISVLISVAFTDRLI